MKRKDTNDLITVNGLYTNEFIRGFFGEQSEGKKMLKRMGLPTDTIPFSAALFMQKGAAQWKDAGGNIAHISYKCKQNQLECYGSYMGQRKSLRIILEWGNNEDIEMIAKLESEAIGDLCMKCIYDNLTNT